LLLCLQAERSLHLDRLWREVGRALDVNLLLWLLLN
jgi:hypothetical protein